jgi:glucose/arabinose dehydrogenase
MAAALLVLAALAGCGGGGGGDDGSGSSTPMAAQGGGGEGTPATQVAARGVRLARIGSFHDPVYVTSPPGDASRLFVVEQAGRVLVIDRGRRLAAPFLDIRDEVTSGGEQGLLSIAFAPDYGDSGRFYAYYTDRAGDQRVVEFRRRDADHADAGSERLVLRMADSASNHNGGLLLFGPDDLLYVGTGDGGGAGDRHGGIGNAQDRGSLLGKILRIDPRPGSGRAYRIPPGNPFRGRAGARAEIYAYGLRNPWRFSFDRATGDLAIGDVGQNAWEEIDFVRRGRGRGANFGWRPFEGDARYTPGESAPGHIDPVIVRSHDAGNCSITGGVVVRDRALPALRGRYIYGDYCKGRIRSARLTPGRARSPRRTSLTVNSLSSFGEDARGRVYAVSLSGPVYRLVPR